MAINTSGDWRDSAPDWRRDAQTSANFVQGFSQGLQRAERKSEFDATQAERKREFDIQNPDPSKPWSMSTTQPPAETKPASPDMSKFGGPDFSWEPSTPQKDWRASSPLEFIGKIAGATKFQDINDALQQNPQAMASPQVQKAIGVVGRTIAQTEHAKVASQAVQNRSVESQARLDLIKKFHERVAEIGDPKAQTALLQSVGQDGLPTQDAWTKLETSEQSKLDKEIEMAKQRGLTITGYTVDSHGRRRPQFKESAPSEPETKETMVGGKLQIWRRGPSGRWEPMKESGKLSSSQTAEANLLKSNLSVLYSTLNKYQLEAQKAATPEESKKIMDLAQATRKQYDEAKKRYLGLFNEQPSGGGTVNPQDPAGVLTP